MAARATVRATNKEKLKDVQYILEVELAGTVNELNMRNEGTRDPVQY